jgi:hypothetical protein
MNALRFERWTESESMMASNRNRYLMYYADEKAIPLEDAQKGNITLILSPEGTPLQTLSQSSEWLKKYQRAHKSKEIRRRAAGVVTMNESNDENSEPDESSGPDPKQRYSGHKASKKAKYIDFSEESDDEDLPYLLRLDLDLLLRLDSDLPLSSGKRAHSGSTRPLCISSSRIFFFLLSLLSKIR